MKTLYKILLLICLSWPCAAWGQMSITKFEKLPNDLDAKVSYKKINPNDGQPFALIKITTDLSCDGFTSFDFGQVGFGVMADCSLGTWVYAPASATRVSITHKMGGSLAPTMINEGKPLEAGTVYVMTLSSNRVVVTYEEETLNIGYFVVQCNVVGARIRIDDGEVEAITDKSWSKALSPGEHTYQIYANGYEREMGKVMINNEKTTAITVNLRSSMGELTITSEPSGAMISIDREIQQEITPATFNVNKGTHEISISKDLYKSVRREVQIEPGGTTVLHEVLPANFASVSIQADSSFDSIFIDNVYKRKGQWSGNLASGLHAIEVRRASHRPHKRSINVVAGQPQSLTTPALTAMYGKVNVETSMNADVYVDGEQKSNVTPCVVQNVLVGRRQVRVVPKNRDYQAYETTVEVSEGKISKVNVPAFEKANLRFVRITANTPCRVFVMAPQTADGKQQVFTGETPFEVTLPVGTSTVTLHTTDPEIQPVDTTVSLSFWASSQQEINKHYTLPVKKIPKTGVLHVSATPKNASIYIDGQNSGTAPFVRTLEEGAHLVRASATGYQTSANQSVYIWPNNHEYINIKLKKDPAVKSKRWSPATESHFFELVYGYGLNGYGHYAGLNYAYVPRRLGLHTSFMYGISENDYLLTLAPVLNFNMGYSSVLQFYAGGGLALESGRYSKKLTWAADAGIRFGFDGDLDGLCTWSFTLGSKYYDGTFVPNVGVCFLPFAALGKDEESYTPFYMEIMNGFAVDYGGGFSDYLLGLNCTWVRRHLGLYGTFMFGVLDYNYSLVAGPVFRCTSSRYNNLDYQLYAGVGWANYCYDNMVAGDFGMRFGFDTKHDVFSWWSVSLGCTMYGTEAIVPTVGLSLGITGSAALVAGSVAAGIVYL